MEETRAQALNYPVIANPDRKVSNVYGMVCPHALQLHYVTCLLIIDASRKERRIPQYRPKLAEVPTSDRQPASRSRECAVMFCLLIGISRLGRRPGLTVSHRRLPGILMGAMFGHDITPRPPEDLAMGWNKFMLLDCH
jgi:hypothetical protein